MRHAAIALALLGSMVIGSLANASDIVVASWNIKRLGHGDQQSFPALAAIASRVDLLAVQEVMTEEGLVRLESELEALTGEEWGRMASHAIGSSSYKEMYGFLWRESAVDYTGGAVVYLDPGDHFIREPFSATFGSKSDGSRLTLASVHILYGDGVSDRLPEIQQLDDYFLWLLETYPDSPVVLAGDFNLDNDHQAWAPLKAHARPLITHGATTLSEIDGRFANRYDNLWVANDTALDIQEAGIINFPQILGWSHSKSRRHVSDHAPVYLALGDAQLDRNSVIVSDPETTAQLPTSAAVTGILGNRNSKIYHRPDCPSYSRISPKNQVSFASANAAVQAGYRIAGNCP